VFGQHPTSKDILSMFNQTPSQIKSLLTSKSFVFQKRDGNLFVYGNDSMDGCIISLGYKNNRLDVLSVEESVTYYSDRSLDLTNAGFVFVKSQPEMQNPIPCQGCLHSYNNTKEKLKCNIAFPRSGATFMMIYGRLDNSK
jgi:hypothetical protein